MPKYVGFCRKDSRITEWGQADAMNTIPFNEYPPDWSHSYEWELRKASDVRDYLDLYDQVLDLQETINDKDEREQNVARTAIEFIEKRMRKMRV